MIRKFIKRSRGVKIIKKLNNIFVRGGSNIDQIPATSDEYISDYDFFRSVIDVDTDNQVDIPFDDLDMIRRDDITRMPNQELKKFLASRSKKLTKDQKLIKSIIEKAKLHRTLSQADLKNVEDMYLLRRKYKNYLRMKRLFPICIIAPFTTNELSKMAFSAALGSKSVSLTLPGLIGYSLPSFFFFHMSQYYAPDKFKSFCQIGKYVAGGPFWVASYIIDGLGSNLEEPLFGEEVPIDLMNTAGTIPNNLGDIEDLRSLLKEMTELGQEFTKKTY